jgi:hypothetical protein
MRSDEQLESQTLALLEARRLDRACDYVRRGRRFAGLRDDEALEGWRRAFISWSREPFDQVRQRGEEDAMAELELRGIDPDYESVRDHFEAAMSVLGGAIDDMRADRSCWHQAGAEMLRELDEHELALAAERARPN